MGKNMEVIRQAMEMSGLQLSELSDSESEVATAAAPTQASSACETTKSQVPSISTGQQRRGKKNHSRNDKSAARSSKCIRIRAPSQKCVTAATAGATAPINAQTLHTGTFISATATTANTQSSQVASLPTSNPTNKWQVFARYMFEHHIIPHLAKESPEIDAYRNAVYLWCGVSMFASALDQRLPAGPDATPASTAYSISIEVLREQGLVFVKPSPLHSLTHS